MGSDPRVSLRVDADRLDAIDAAVEADPKLGSRSALLREGIDRALAAREETARCPCCNEEPGEVPWQLPEGTRECTTSTCPVDRWSVDDE